MAITLGSVLMAIRTVTMPKYDGTVRVSSNYGKITIHRDEYGVPHLFADNEKAAYFGLGYLHAQDRLWMFEKFRRLARGTVSEMLGDEALPVDYLLRQLSMDKVSKEAAKKIPKEVIEDFKAVAEGINEFIRDNVLPIEYYILGVECKPYTYLDILAVEKFIDFAVSYNHQMELTRDIVFKATNSSELAKKYMPFEEKYFRHNNFPTVDDEELKKSGLYVEDGMRKASKNYKPTYSRYNITASNIYEDVRRTLGMIHFDGSNGWVIHGNHTKSGKPILSTDPHLTNTLPCLWLLAEVTYGNYTTAGIFTTGQPWIMMGRTNDLAYGITAIHSDVIDFYEETLVDDGKFYMYDGHKIPVKQRKEYIKVKDLFAPSGYRLEEIIINSTHHGPLLHDPFNKAYDFLKRLPYDGFGRKDLALAWVGYQGVSEYYANNRCLSKAKDVPEGINCFKNPGTQNINILMADKKGNIGYTPIVSYPIRKNPYASAFIQDGSKSENDWKGYVPFEELPKVINPARGYIANSNSMLTSQNVKYGVGALMPSTPRVIRTKELIEAQIKSGKKFTAIDMIRMQLDSVDVNAR